jgi:hypothetical protein
VPTEDGTPEPTSIALPVIGAHGGSGASTLARFLGDGAEEAEVDHAGQLVGAGVDDGGDCGGIRAGIGATPLVHWQHRPVVVVGRGTAWGVARAGGLGGLLVEHGLLVVVAIVSDGPLREPVPVRARLRAMRGWTTAIVRVPYVTRWRVIDFAADPPGDYLDAVEQVREAVRLSGSGRSRSHQSATGKGRRANRKEHR